MSQIPAVQGAKSSVFLGINIDKTSVSAIAVSENGDEIAESSAPFNVNEDVAPLQKGVIEQNPEIWWEATRSAIGQLCGKLRAKSISPSQLRSICVCGVPGALVILDRAGRPMMNAILYEDARATEQLPMLNFHGQDHCKKMGFTFKANHPIAKIAWVKDNLPEIYENATFCHQTDYIVGKLKGNADVTEYSIATRTGCDLIDECWPDWMDYDLHLGVRDRLPKLATLGTVIGNVNQKASAATGLPTNLPVVNGSISDTAAFIASGARKVGDYSLSIDDHLTIRGMTKKMLAYPRHLLHMYKLPNKIWFFSTECNTGADWIRVWFSEPMIPALQQQAIALLPTDYLAYPNVRKGETFPFSSNSAEGFISPATENYPVQFASCLQGTALLERLCYRKIERLSGVSETSRSGDIYSNGLWSRYDAWMQCRADVSGRINHRLQNTSTAPFGAAMIAAFGSHFHSFEDTADSMLRIEQSFYPNPSLIAAYNEKFHAFSSLMENQGYG